MNGIDNMPAWAAVAVAALLVVGSTIVVIGALGLLRLPTFYQRIHGPAIIVTLGGGFLLLASMLYFTVAQSRLVIHEVIIAVFLLLTAPVVAMTIMRAAVYRDLRARRHGEAVMAGEVYGFAQDGGAQAPDQPKN